MQECSNNNGIGQDKKNDNWSPAKFRTCAFIPGIFRGQVQVYETRGSIVIEDS